jgi:ribosomal protein L7/L12
MDVTLTVVGIAALVVGFIAGRASAGIEHPRVTLSAPPLDGPVDPQIVALVQGGRKIDAIRLYRQLYKVDLKQAKDAIDSLGEQKLP